MEILQTIWTTLTTENEVLTNIIFIPEVFLEIFINMLLFTTLLNINISSNTKKKYVIILSIIVNITTLIIPNPYCSYLNLIIQIIFAFYLFKTNILKSIMTAVLPIIVTVLCESVIIKLCNTFFNFDATTLSFIPIYRLILTLSIQLFVFIIYLIIKYLKINIVFFENMSKKSKIIFTLNFVFAIISISIQFIITGFYIDKLPIYIIIFSNITLIIYFLLSIYSLTKTTQLEITALNLEQEKEHNRILKLAQDDLHGFRHDFANIMCTIGGYVHVKDMEGLSNYYHQIQKDVVKVNNLSALDPSIINNPAVFTLIASKYDKASENNITMNINCLLDLNNLNMKIYEFTRILGILLDNAIEAAKECNEKMIYLEIRKDTHRNRQLLIIENTYANKDINIDKIFEKNYSTKQGNSGIGLWEVRQILKRNTNLNLFTTKDERLFKQQLEIYNV